MMEKRYHTPDDKAPADMAAEPTGAYSTTAQELQHLRHNIIDAVYASQDKHKLYSCWEILSDATNDATSDDIDEWGNRILAKEEGEQLLRDTLVPALRDVKETERCGDQLPDAHELLFMDDIWK